MQSVSESINFKWSCTQRYTGVFRTLSNSSTVDVYQVPKHHFDTSVTKYILYTNNGNAWSVCRSGQSSEAFTQRFYVKEVFWKVSQNLVENNLIPVFSMEFSKIFENFFLIGHLQTTASQSLKLSLHCHIWTN